MARNAKRINMGTINSEALGYISKFNMGFFDCSMDAPKAEMDKAEKAIEEIKAQRKEYCAANGDTLEAVNEAIAKFPMTDANIALADAKSEYDKARKARNDAMKYGRALVSKELIDAAEVYRLTGGYATFKKELANFLAEIGIDASSDKALEKLVAGINLSKKASKKERAEGKRVTQASKSTVVDTFILTFVDVLINSGTVDENEDHSLTMHDFSKDAEETEAQQ